MSVRSYRDLLAWQKAIALSKAVYLACDDFPKHETYGIASQVKRSAVSVAANLAEGHARETTRDFLRFINIAYSSLAETETHLILAAELNMLAQDHVTPLLEQSGELGRILNGLARSLKAKIPDPRPLTPDPL